jgi:hypothetical protein
MEREHYRDIYAICTNSALETTSGNIHRATTICHLGAYSKVFGKDNGKVQLSAYAHP